MHKEESIVVSVQGFYFSGSTAVMDILKECDNTIQYYSQSVYHGKIDNKFEESLEKGQQGEMQFFNYLSLQSIYNALLSYNKTRINYVLRETVLKCYEITQQKFHQKTYWRYINQKVDLNILKILLNDFLFKIIKLTENDRKILNPIKNEMYFPVSIYNSKLEPFNITPSYFKSRFFEKIKECSFVKDGYVFYEISEDLSINTFCIYVKELLTSIFNFLNHDKDILVLDNFLIRKSIMDFPDFFPKNFKLIAVYRDPRDIYVYYQNLRVRDVSSEQNVNKFCKIYSEYNLLEKYKNTNNVLLIRFEELLSDYDNQLLKIFNFLHIDPIHHINKQKYFNPKIKRDSVGIHNFYPEKKSIDLIELYLSEWL